MVSYPRSSAFVRVPSPRASIRYCIENTRRASDYNTSAKHAAAPQRRQHLGVEIERMVELRDERQVQRSLAASQRARRRAVTIHHRNRADHQANRAWRAAGRLRGPIGGGAHLWDHGGVARAADLDLV